MEVLKLSFQKMLRYLSLIIILNTVLSVMNKSYSDALKPSCKIVTSFSILRDMVQNVIGDVCQVISIVQENADAHVFEPTPATSKIILDADLVIINGLGFERWIDKLIHAAHYTKPVEVAAKYIKPRILYTPALQGAKVVDPHAWLTLDNGQLYVQAIQEILEKRFPEHLKIFQKNASVYQQKMVDLERYIQNQLKCIDVSKRQVITAHDAFGYTGDHYHITFMAPIGISTEAEPSAQQMVKLIEQIRQLNIQALFVENIINQKIIEQIAEETGVAIYGRLYSDALSHVDEPASTYLKLMEHNMELLTTAMKGQSF